MILMCSVTVACLIFIHMIFGSVAYYIYKESGFKEAFRELWLLYFCGMGVWVPIHSMWIHIMITENQWL